MRGASEKSLGFVVISLMLLQLVAGEVELTDYISERKVDSYRFS